MDEKSLIVVPTYNERDNLLLLAQDIFSVVPETHILIVDDNSPDGTGALADEMSQKDSRFSVIHRSGKLGLGTAYIAGFKYGLEKDYSFLLEMDADFSHNPRYLPQLLERAKHGADLVLGSRYAKGGGTLNWGIGRKLISRGGSLYARTILGVKVRDLTGGFKCFRRHVLEAIDLDSIHSEGYSFQIEMTYQTIQKGFVVEELPIVFEDRRVGQSKMSKAIFFEALSVVWKLRFGMRQ